MKHKNRMLAHKTLAILLVCFSSTMDCMFLKRPLTPMARILQQRTFAIPKNLSPRKILLPSIPITIQASNDIITVDKKILDQSETLTMLLSRARPGNTLNLSDYSKEFLTDTFNLIEGINEKRIDNYPLNQLIPIANFLDAYQFNQNINNIVAHQILLSLQKLSIEKLCMHQ